MIRTVPVGIYPYGVAVDPAARTFYVTNFWGDTVSVTNEATDRVTATVPVASDPDAGVMDPAARTDYVANSDSLASVPPKVPAAEIPAVPGQQCS